MLRGVDPSTGESPVYTKGKLKGQPKPPPNRSSSFRSNEAYAQAEQSARAQQDFIDGKAQGKAEIVIEDLSLRDALGNDYLSHVEGRTTVGAAPGATRSTDFTNGTVTAVYRRNIKTGDYDLVTMYPEGK